MFFQPPDKELHKQNVKNQRQNSKQKRKRKHKQKNKQQSIKKDVFKRKNPRFALTMSSWAENFAFASTWQLKHQLAYWKARAKALEYENGVLHDVIRINHMKPSSQEVGTSDSEFEEETNGEDVEGDDFEVSEEFIQFLTANAKYKEDARRERERLNAKYDSETAIIERMEAGPSQSPQDKQEELKELYGDKWQRISALEMSLQSQFISACDKEKPMHWPNIPFNFNFS